MEFTVIVTFKTQPETHDAARDLISRYIDEFLRIQPGFLGSRLLGNESGLVHCARWQQEADFRAFADKARDHPLLPSIRKFDPSASFYSTYVEFAPG